MNKPDSRPAPRVPSDARAIPLADAALAPVFGGMGEAMEVWGGPDGAESCIPVPFPKRR